MSSPSNNGNSSVIEWFVLPAMLALVCWALWYVLHAHVIAYTLIASSYAFPLFAQIPSPILPERTATEMMVIAKSLHAIELREHGWDTFTTLLGLWGSALRILLIPALLWMAYSNFKLPPSYRYRRKMTLKLLAEQNRTQFPSIAPALGKELHKSDPHEGPWAVPRSYIDFASEANLLRYKGEPVEPIITKQMRLSVPKKRKLFRHHSFMSIDKPAADALYARQLGKPWRGVDAITDPLLRGLLAAFMARVAGGDYRDQGYKLLDQISATYVEGGVTDKGAVTHTADVRGADQLLEGLQRHPAVVEIVERHGFESTVFMGLLAAARKKGKLSPSLFLWLRPTNRTLWYSLHPLGGRKPWPEGAAAWAHYESELQLGKAIHTPVVEGATDALEKALHDEKWILAEHLYEAEQEAIRKDLEAAKRHSEMQEANRKAGAGPRKRG